MILGTASIGHDGLQEVTTIVFVPVPVIDELEGGEAGIVWYVEMELFDKNPVLEEF